MKNQVTWLTLWAAMCMFVLGCVHWINKSVTAMSEKAPVSCPYSIVIDAGHGMPDGGAISCTGKPESEYNLEIARRLQDLIHLLGQETVMVRNTENSVYTGGTTIAQKKRSDLKERVEIVSNAKNPVLISIHQNSFPEEQYKGAVVLYADTSGSQEFGETVQILFNLNLKSSKREAKPAEGIYLMEHIACPGILIECGFLSNPAEEAALQSSEYQKLLACVISSATLKFLEDRQQNMQAICSEGSL